MPPPRRADGRAVLAPIECVTYHDDLSPDNVVLVAKDLDGAIWAELRVAREDAEWWIRAARFLLALRHGAAKLRLLSKGSGVILLLASLAS